MTSTTLSRLSLVRLILLAEAAQRLLFDNWVPVLSAAFGCADACATFSQERHDHSLKTINGFCRQRTVQQLSDELQSLK